jgi:hypothetical protein
MKVPFEFAADVIAETLFEGFVGDVVKISEGFARGEEERRRSDRA